MFRNSEEWSLPAVQNSLAQMLKILPHLVFRRMLASGSNMWPVLPSVAQSYQTTPRQSPGHSVLTTSGCPELKCSYPGCLYTSKFGYNMRRHQRLHTGETIACPHCHRGYHSDGALKVHIQRHHQFNQNQDNVSHTQQLPDKELL